MPKEVRIFGSGSIIAILTATLIGVISWIGVQASHVPVIEATFKNEIRHLNQSIKKLTVTAENTNMQLEAYTKYHAQNLARITESLINHKVRIDEITKDCDENRQEIKRCKMLYGEKREAR